MLVRQEKGYYLRQKGPEFSPVAFACIIRNQRVALRRDLGSATVERTQSDSTFNWQEGAAGSGVFILAGDGVYYPIYVEELTTNRARRRRVSLAF